jgi:hypothetical protein
MSDFEFISKCKRAISLLESVQEKLEYCTARHEEAKARLEGKKEAA